MKHLSIVTLIALLLGSCSATIEDLELPTPFTAQEIRDANPAGTSVRYRLRMLNGPSGVQTIAFVETDEEGAVVESGVVSEAGAEISPMLLSPKATWEELRDHASYDPAWAVRRRGVAVVPAGTFHGWQYTLMGPEGTVTEIYFADELPGPPVLLHETKDGEELMRMELLSKDQ